MIENCAVMIICQNEEENIRKCLESVCNNFTEIFVCDGFSIDKTKSILKEYPVQFTQNIFEHWAKQREHLLRWSKTSSEYILFLDADEEITNELAKEIAFFIKNKENDVGLFKVDNFFMNKKLKFSYGHPMVPRIFKKAKYHSIDAKGAREYFKYTGKTYTFKNHLTHNDLKPISSTIYKHLKNSKIESAHITSNKDKTDISSLNEFIRHRIWLKIPLSLRPIIYFTYRYILRGGFRDGFPGFVFCAIQAFFYQTLVAYHIYEPKRKN